VKGESSVEDQSKKQTEERKREKRKSENDKEEGKGPLQKKELGRNAELRNNKWKGGKISSPSVR